MYEVILPGTQIQIRVEKILLNSVRDWTILAVVLATMGNQGKGVPSAIAGDAVASLVRSALANIHRMDERVGERCIVKTILTIMKRSGERRAVEKREIADHLSAGGCLLAGCKYRSGVHCTLNAEELEAPLEQMERSEILLKAGTTSYRIA